jgi:hypothetical protein
MKLSLALIAGRKRIGVRKMNYRNYKNKKQISQLVFGAMRLPRFSDDQTDIDVKLTEEIILYAYEHGVNYYDTRLRLSQRKIGGCSGGDFKQKQYSVIK